MRIEIDYDILNRRQNIYCWRDIGNDEAECIKMSFTKEKVMAGLPLVASTLPREEGIEFFKSMATALQRAGYLPESATTAELKAVRSELETVKKQHQQMLDAIIGVTNEFNKNP